MKNYFVQQSKDYARIEMAICFLGENFQEQPSLQEVARKINMSEYHFQRVFQRWAGISPKKFLQYLTKEYAKELLKNSNLLDVSLSAGLSSPSRLHDLFVNCEAMTPGEFKDKAKGLVIEYGIHPSPLGECFIALTDRGLCALSFIETGKRKAFMQEFKQYWKNARLVQTQDKTKKLVRLIFSQRGSKKDSINVLCKGTQFQLKVWEALLKIPYGKVVTYKTIAQMIGAPKAVRAVGTAIGQNPVAYLIPCHRVIREAGHMGGYRWGIPRKKAILAMEACRSHYSDLS